MLNRAEKEAIVSGLKVDIEKSQAIFLTNLIGLPSNDAVRLRKAVRDAKGKIAITRNSLLERASKGTSLEGMFQNVKGPHALAFAYEDAAAVAKCIKDASKVFDGIVELKAGVLEGQALSRTDLQLLADLPSRDQMLGTLLATFLAPVSAFARVLHAINEEKAKATVSA